MSDKSKISFAWHIARRYLFSRKSHNVINIISGISAAGVTVVTAALVCVLSVFNGFENLVGTLYSAFDPDLKILPVEGKNFDINTEKFKKLFQIPEIETVSEVVEDNALLRYGDKQMPATVKGVSDNFEQMTRIDSIMYDGKYQLFDGAFHRSVVGLGVAAMLGLNPNFFEPLRLYAPKREGRVNTLRPDQSVTDVLTFPAGIFSVQQVQYDDNYVITSIALARELFEMDSTTVSSIEIKLKPDKNIDKVKKQIQKITGQQFTVKNRIEQQESFFRILKIEKWIAALILVFILLIASFNIISSLSMLIIDKKEDIQTLKNLGADNSLIQRIFMFEGWLISIAGAVIGITVGTIFCLVQQHIGVIRMGEGYMVDSYPVILHFVDVVLVFFAVVVLGFLASYYPARYAGKAGK
jgi:lipoprotein releasing system LolC/E family transmembrane protein